MEMETLLRTLQAKDKVDLNWRKTANELRQAVQHHVQEEETEIIPMAATLFTEEESNMMEKAFSTLKPEIKEEGLLQTSLELITNLMPRRFVPAFRSIDLESRI